MKKFNPAVWPCLILLALCATTSRAAFEGGVTALNGRPVAGVRVDWPGGTALSDSAGRFRLPDEAALATLTIQHPLFRTQQVKAPGAGATTPLVIVLEPLGSVDEEILVSAQRQTVSDLPASATYATVTQEAMRSAQGTLTEVVEALPGVAANGQGGVFQVISVRGVSRHRIITSLAGMRITGERRAGVSASFLDPRLIGSIDILRGPASTLYGSGALGGVAILELLQPQGGVVETGWDSNGNERRVMAGWGNAGWSAAFAAREADDGKEPDGAPLNTHFAQYSGLFQRRWKGADLDWDFTFIPSFGRNLGKSNRDFPDRVTNYPYENHILMRLSATRADAWGASVYGHFNELKTVTTRPGRRNEVFNEAVDFGVQGWREWHPLDRRLKIRVGADLFGRNGVDAREVEYRNLAPGAAPTSDLTPLLGAREAEQALFGEIRLRAGPALFEGGLRYTRQSQSNFGYATRRDAAWSGHAGAVFNLPHGVVLHGSLGSGLRFPNLSERFYSGATPRGGIIGNPDLLPERAENGEVGVRWFGTSAQAGVNVFRNRISRFVEQVPVGGGITTFVNLNQGTIEGVEFDGHWQLARDWRFTAGGHLLHGETAAGDPLSDIPVHRAQLGLRFRSGRWRAEADWQYRHHKHRFGPDEMAIESARLWSLTAGCELGGGFTLTATGDNLTDARYFNSADNQAAPMAGRSFGLQLRWATK